MAVVGSAYVVVRAITDRVEEDIKRGFSGASVSARRAGQEMGSALTRGLNIGARENKLTALRDQLRSLYPEAEESSRAFTRLARRGYVVQAAIGALVGSLGALVGGLGALIGSIGGAVPALFALGGAAVAARVAIGTAQFSLNGVAEAVQKATDPTNDLGGAVSELAKRYEDLQFAAEEAALTENRAALNLEKAREGLLRTADLAPNSRARREALLAFEEAELAYRKAISNSEDLNDQLAQGLGGAGSADDPFAGLTESQKQFAEFLVSLDGLQDDLRESAASGFLPILEEQLSRIIASGYLDALNTGLNDIGEAAGEAVGRFNDVLLTGDNLSDFRQSLENIADYTPTFGRILGNVFDAFLSALVAADPLIQRFIGWIEESTNKLAAYLDLKQQSGELERFFNQAGDNAAKFGTIFGNTFDGLVNIIEANFTPGTGGWIILDWLEEVTQAWADVDKVFLRSYFVNSAENFVAIGNALGGALETLLRLGADPSVGEFWRTLDEGSYEFQQFLTAAVQSAPALAEVLQTLTGILAAFTDAGVPTTFFTVINTALSSVEEILIALKPLLDTVIGQIFAAASAAGLLLLGLTKIGTIGTGFIVRMVGALGTILPTSVLAKLGLAKVTAAAVAAAGAMAPILPLVAGISLVVGGLVAAVSIHASNMNKATDSVSESLRKGADATEIWKGATLAIPDAFKGSVDSIDELKDSMARLRDEQRGFTVTADGVKRYARFATPALTGMADSLGAIGRSLADVASTDLVTAQAQFNKFTSEVGFSNEEIGVALNEMDEYKKLLIEQADQLDINIRGLDGEIDMRKLANFAIGEGTIKLRREREERKQLEIERAAQTRAEILRIQEIADGFLDYRGNLQQSKDDLRAWAEAQAAETADATDTWEDYWDGQSFSMEKYLTDLETQVAAAQDWKNNLAKLSGELPKEIYDKVAEMGEAGAQLVAALTDGVNDEEERDRLIRAMTGIGIDAAGAVGDAFSNGIANLPANVRERLAQPGTRQFFKDGGYVGRAFSSGGLVTGIGTSRSDSIPAFLSNGEFVVNARATAANRELLEAINSNKTISNRPNVNIVVNPAPGMDEKQIASIVSRRLAFEIRRGGI